MSFDTQLFGTILSALGRDDELRRAMLQRRWRGVAEDGGRGGLAGSGNKGEDVHRFPGAKLEGHHSARVTRPSGPQR